MIAWRIRATRCSPSAGARAASRDAISRSRPWSRSVAGLCRWTAAVSAARRANRSPSWRSTSSMSHLDVGSALLVGRPVGPLELDQPVPTVERAGRCVLLEDPQTEPVGGLLLGQVEQRRADALPGVVGHDVQVVDPGPAEPQVPHRLAGGLGDPDVVVPHPAGQPRPHLGVGVHGGRHRGGPAGGEMDPRERRGVGLLGPPDGQLSGRHGSSPAPPPGRRGSPTHT
jgi:hypothetical protein